MENDTPEETSDQGDASTEAPKEKPASKGRSAKASPKNKTLSATGQSEKFIERLVMAIVVVFSILVLGGSWIIGPDKLTNFASGMIGSKSGNAKSRFTNCMSAKNKNSSYCKEQRARLAKEWRGIERNKGGGGTAFGLSGTDSNKRRR